MHLRDDDSVELVSFWWMQHLIKISRFRAKATGADVMAAVCSFKEPLERDLWRAHLFLSRWRAASDIIVAAQQNFDGFSVGRQVLLCITLGGLNSIITASLFNAIATNVINLFWTMGLNTMVIFFFFFLYIILWWMKERLSGFIQTPHQHCMSNKIIAHLSLSSKDKAAACDKRSCWIGVQLSSQIMWTCCNKTWWKCLHAYNMHESVAFIICGDKIFNLDSVKPI